MLAVLIALRPPLTTEIAAELNELATRLPELLDVADELLRPSMQLYDWYVLQDSLLNACGGSFVSHRSASLAAVFAVRCRRLERLFEKTKRRTSHAQPSPALPPPSYPHPIPVEFSPP